MNELTTDRKPAEIGPKLCSENDSILIKSACIWDWKTGKKVSKKTLKDKQTNWERLAKSKTPKIYFRFSANSLSQSSRNDAVTDYVFQ